MPSSSKQRHMFEPVSQHISTDLEWSDQSINPNPPRPASLALFFPAAVVKKHQIWIQEVQSRWVATRCTHKILYIYSDAGIALAQVMTQSFWRCQTFFCGPTCHFPKIRRKFDDWLLAAGHVPAMTKYPFAHGHEYSFVYAYSCAGVWASCGQTLYIVKSCICIYLSFWKHQVAGSEIRKQKVHQTLITCSSNSVCFLYKFPSDFCWFGKMLPAAVLTWPNVSCTCSPSPGQDLELLYSCDPSPFRNTNCWTVAAGRILP